MKDRIDYLERRIQMLEKRITQLEDNPSQTTQSTPALVQTNSESVANQAPVKQEDQSPAPAGGLLASYQATYQNQENEPSHQHEPSTQQEPRQTPFYDAKPMDMERKIGMQVMGIIASILIFIGLCFLAVLVYPYFGEEMKFAAMCTASLAVLAGGLLVYRKYKNAFSLSLMSCGIGMIYISFVLTHLYFHYINNYVLYGLFLLWIIGTIYLSQRLTSILFRIISLIGFTISIFIGLTMVQTAEEILFLNIFQSASIFIYLFVNISNRLASRQVVFIMAAVFPLLHLLSNLDAWNWIDTVAGSLQWQYVLSIIILALPAITSFFKCLQLPRDHSARTAILTVLFFSNILFFFIAGEELQSYLSQTFLTSMGAALGLILSLSMLAVLELKGCPFSLRITSLVTISIQYVHFVFIEEGILESPMELVGLLPLAVAALLIGWRKQNKTYLLLGVVTTYFNALWWEHGGLFEWMTYYRFALILISLLVVLCLLPAMKALTHPAWKTITYAVFLMVIFQFIAEMDMSDSFPAALLIVGVINLLMLFTGFANKWDTVQDLLVRKEGENKSVLLVLQGITELTLLSGLIYLQDVLSTPIKWTLVLFCLSACAINMFTYLKRQKSSDWMGYVWGIRITIVFLACMFSFLSWEDYAVLGTITCLILAIFFILWGFHVKTKSYRLFGLILALVAVAKLLLLDIVYENNMMKVAGFIGGGIICFVISWAYNHLSKKLDNKEDED